MPVHFLRIAALIAIVAAPLFADATRDWNSAIDAGKKAFEARNFAEAQKQFELAVKAGETFGNKDTRLAAALDHLATVLSVNKEYDKAIPVYLRAVAVIEAAYDKGHPDLIGTLQNLARVYQVQNKIAEAQPLYERVRVIVEATYGKDDLRTAIALNNLAAIEGVKGEHTKAVALLEQTLAIREKKLPADHALILQTLTDLGNTCFRANKLDEAQKYYERALAITEKTQANKPPVVDAINRLAALHDARQQFSKSLPLYQKALEMLEKNLGKEHAMIGPALSKLANTHAALEEYDLARPLFVRALSVQEKTLGAENVEVGKTNFSLGRLLVQQKKFAEAEPYCKKSIAIFQKAAGTSSPLYAVAVLNYAVVMENTGRVQEAAKLKQLIEQLQKAKDKK